MTSRFVFSVAPGLAAAFSLGVADVLAKIIIASHCDVLTMLLFRSVVGLALMTVWLRLGPKPPPVDARVRLISIGIGVLFSVLIFCLFKAIEANDVPTAILTYFIYPLLTGLVAAATGLERLRWQGVLCALAAFVGLAIMIGAHPAGLALAGIAFAVAAACCRTGVLDFHARISCRCRRAADDLVLGDGAAGDIRRCGAFHSDLGSRRKPTAAGWH